VLLKVIHKINPNVVDWKRVEKNPNNHFKKGKCVMSEIYSVCTQELPEADSASGAIGESRRRVWRTS
jgi:hypothetical protein